MLPYDGRMGWKEQRCTGNSYGGGRLLLYVVLFGVADPEVSWAVVPGLYVRPCSQVSTCDRGSWLANFMAVPFDLRLFNLRYNNG